LSSVWRTVPEDELDGALRQCAVCARVVLAVVGEVTLRVRREVYPYAISNRALDVPRATGTWWQCMQRSAYRATALAADARTVHEEVTTLRALCVVQAIRVDVDYPQLEFQPQTGSA